MSKEIINRAFLSLGVVVVVMMAAGCDRTAI